MGKTAESIPQRVSDHPDRFGVIPSANATVHMRSPVVRKGKHQFSNVKAQKTVGPQHMERSQLPQPHVLLLDLDTRRRNQLASVLRGKGFEISVMSHIAEMERWPAGQIVVVDAARFTPWWIEVGAVRVVVLSAAAVEESRVYNGVPCMWIPCGAGPDALIAAL